MCNYVGYRVTKQHYIRLKHFEMQFGVYAALETLKNGFAYGNWEVVRGIENKDEIEVAKMHWEFIPWWINNTEELLATRKNGIPWLNATAEKILSSKMFREAALKRRCLIPVSWFFEWRHFHPAGAKKEMAFPYCITIPNQEYFFIAGIWQPWTDKETGELIDTFAIVTTKANELMEEIHNTKKRMPTILTEELAYEWVLGNLSEERIQQIASFQFPSAKMFAFTIRKDFRSAPDPIEPFDYEYLPQLTNTL